MVVSEFTVTCGVTRKKVPEERSPGFGCRRHPRDATDWSNSARSTISAVDQECAVAPTLTIKAESGVQCRYRISKSDRYSDGMVSVRISVWNLHFLKQRNKGLAEVTIACWLCEYRTVNHDTKCGYWKIQTCTLSNKLQGRLSNWNFHLLPLYQFHEKI